MELLDQLEAENPEDASLAPKVQPARRSRTARMRVHVAQPRPRPTARASAHMSTRVDAMDADAFTLMLGPLRPCTMGSWGWMWAADGAAQSLSSREARVVRLSLLLRRTADPVGLGGHLC